MLYNNVIYRPIALLYSIVPYDTIFYIPISYEIIACNKKVCNTIYKYTIV